MADNDIRDKSDFKKMAMLEDQLRRLIVAVDDRLSNAPPDHLRRSLGQKDGMWHLPIADWTSKHWGILAGAGFVLFATGWIGSSSLYSMRLEAQVENKLRPYAQELAATVTTIQTGLGPQLATADQLKTEIEGARRALVARDEEFDETIETAQNQLLGIRDSAINDIERRLTDQTDDLTSTLEMFRQRAVELDQGLTEVSQALAAFDNQLPAITENFGAVASKLAESQTILDRVSEEATALDGLAPPLLTSITNHQGSLETGTKTIAELEAALAKLKGQTAESSAQLAVIMEQGRDQITNWETMDRQVDDRQREIMRTLDIYANSLNSRVREFLDVLADETAFNGG